MTLSTVSALRHVCVWVMMAFAAFGLITQNSGNEVLLTVALVGTVVPILALLVLNFFWKCPHCDRHLNGRLYSIEYCPHCGEYLFTE